MTTINNYNKNQVIIPGRTNGSHFQFTEFQQLRSLNYRIANIVSRIILSLFSDYYLPLKH